MEVDPKAGDKAEEMEVDFEGPEIDTGEQDEDRKDQKKEDQDEEGEDEETEEPDEELGPDIYHVKKILGMQIFGRTLKYKVRWEGYGSEDDTWEPASNLLGEGAQKMLKAYRHKYKENVERLEGNLRGAAAKQSGAPRAGWKYISADDIDGGEGERDRELKLDDNFYDESVSELKGEKKHLVDLTRRVTHSERFLAELGSRERVTRKTLKFLKGDNGVKKTSSSPSTSFTLTTSRKPSSSSGFSVKKHQSLVKKTRLPSELSSTSSTASRASTSLNNNNNDEGDKTQFKKKVRKPATKLFCAKEPDVLSCLDGAVDSSESRNGRQADDLNFGEEKARIAAGSDSARKTKNKKHRQPGPSNDDDGVFNPAHQSPSPVPISHLPILKNVDWDALIDEPSPKQEVEPPTNFVEAVMSGDAQNFLHLQQEMSPEKFAQNCGFTEPDTGMNCLHKLCAMPCDSSHGVCDIIGIICKAAGKTLLKQQNNHEKTPLHIAVANGFKCRVRVLLRYGAPLNIADNYGKTPVDGAYSSKNPDIWKVILRVGANYTYVQNQPNREIIHAQEEILREHSRTVDRLLKKARAKVLYGSRELRVLSPVLTSPFYDGPQFIFHVDYKEGTLPACAVIKLMCFVCSFYGSPENWTARCWGGLHMRGHPKLNGIPLVPVCNDNYPMIYHCPLKNGRNQISITCANADTNSLVFAAQVVAFDPMSGRQMTAPPPRFG